MNDSQRFWVTVAEHPLISHDAQSDAPVSRMWYPILARAVD